MDRRLTTQPTLLKIPLLHHAVGHDPDMLVLRLCGQEKSPITEHVPVPLVRLNHACRCQCGAEHQATPCAVYRFRVPVEGVSPRRVGAPVQRAKGAKHPIRWEGFHRRPEIDQSLLRWGADEIGPDVRPDQSTKSGAFYVNLIVPYL